MARLDFDRAALRHNHRALAQRLPERIHWGIVTKLLCGHAPFLDEVLALEPGEVFDARLDHLETIRSLRPDIPTGYIRPAAPHEAERVVRAADTSYASDPAALAALDAAAADLGVRHGVVVMVELGDLREGAPHARAAEIAERVVAHPNLELQGLGGNFACLNGVRPSRDKMVQLELLAEIVELRTGVRPPRLSGGASVALPPLFAGELPDAIDHFRIGEALFFGRDLRRDATFEGMRGDVFTLEARVLEVHAKPSRPYGERGDTAFGAAPDVSDHAAPRSGDVRRALLDVGRLDVDPSDLTPLDEGVRIAGGSSDLTAVDVDARGRSTRSGDTLRFRVGYRGALALMNSRYVEKRVTGSPGCVVPDPGAERIEANAAD